MTDLTERLRNWRRVYLEDDGRPEGALYHEAADEIDRLRAVVAKLCDAAERGGDELAAWLESALSLEENGFDVGGTEGAMWACLDAAKEGRAALQETDR